MLLTDGALKCACVCVCGRVGDQCVLCASCDLWFAACPGPFHRQAESSRVK